MDSQTLEIAPSVTDITEVDESRRRFLKTGGLALGATAGFAIGTGATAPACNPKNLSTYVQMFAGGFLEIKELLPTLGLPQAVIDQIASLIDKGVKVAAAFDKAYEDGKFTDAATLFTNLGTIITDVVKILGVSVENRAVKVALAAIGIARVAISILLKRQVEAQAQVAGGVRDAMRQPGSPEAKAIAEIEKLAATDVGKILALLPQ